MRSDDYFGILLDTYGDADRECSGSDRPVKREDALRGRTRMAHRPSAMPDPFFELTRGEGPLVATAVHDGGAVRPEVARLMAWSEADRLREEDPFTGGWTAMAPTRLVVRRSRFEVDLNRPREGAVYLTPDDAWGRTVWTAPPPPDLIERSLAEYDAFYAAVHELLGDLTRRVGRFVVFDLHTYNHRREGPTAPAADPAETPEVNVGTGTTDRARWAPVVERFKEDLRAFDFFGRSLDVRENVKFQGGRFPRWIHETFPDTGCALAVEVKKFFMDEWTGDADLGQAEAIGRALASTVPGVLEALGRM